MLRLYTPSGSLVAFLLFALPLHGQNRRQPGTVDLNALRQIRAAELVSADGKTSSQIAEIAYHLTDLYGPRLTNSPQFRRAAGWAVTQLNGWRLTNVHLEKWPTPPDRPLPSWQSKSIRASMVEPSYQPLLAVPEAWSPATGGRIEGEAMLFELPHSMEELARIRGKRAGKIILLGGPAMFLPLPETPLVHRFTSQELAALGLDLSPAQDLLTPSAEPALSDSLMAAIGEWLSQDKPLAILRSGAETDTRGVPAPSYWGGAIRGPGFLNASVAYSQPVAILGADDYNRIARLLARHVPVKLQLEIETEQDDAYKAESVNVIAEIPGLHKPREIVMAGAHLDSWAYGTGATDNAIGCAAVMEAMRILRSSNLPMDRTVRLALWGGEEEGLLGSRAYVKEHFGGRRNTPVKPEHENFSVYFNLDGGSGKIRGIYLRHNEMARPIFEDWFAPLHDLTTGAIAARDVESGILDHFAFDEVGLPAFHFLQDPLDSETRTHHTNMDTFDRIQLPEAEQMAVVLASFLYDAATRPEKMPRKYPESQPH